MFGAETCQKSGPGSLFGKCFAAAVQIRDRKIGRLISGAPLRVKLLDLMTDGPWTYRGNFEYG